MTQDFVINDEFMDKLSAYIDGELPANEAAAIERLAAKHPSIQAEIDALRALDVALVEGFDALLDDQLTDLPETYDVPEERPLPKAANSNQPRSAWMNIAAALTFLVIGAGAGGYLTHTYAPQTIEVVKQRGWMSYIADYHQVYAGEKRHLV